jgi:Domain of unknown function (DUF3883)
LGAEQQITRSAVEEALAEFRNIGRTAFLQKYGFGKAREYFVRDPVSGDLADSKAIAGAAYGYVFPSRGPLSAATFSGGEDTVAAALRALGFEVQAAGSDWSEDEVRFTVADYFQMLGLEAEHQPYVKAERNRALRDHLRSRSKASVELKHQNISAVLNAIDMPYIPGYKPRGNAQRLLREEVQRYIGEHPDAVRAIVAGLERVPDRTAQIVDFVSSLIDIPRGAPASATPRKRVARKIDFARQDERNRSLGRQGERWVIELERERLRRAGRADLGASIEWVADTQGDGAGYDVRSSESDGSQIFIEVKTTNGGELTPFLLSPNELECSRELGTKFRLYRVFEFFTRPRLFIIPGPIDEHVKPEPSEYRVRFGAPK